DVTSPGTSTAGVPTGWTAFNEGGPADIGSQWAGGADYTTNTPLGGPADGNQYCYINMFNLGVTGGIYQDTEALQSNTVYTLTVAIGSRHDRVNSAGILSLLNGTNNLGAVLASVGGLPTAQNTWRDYSVTYTTGASIHGNLTIELSVPGNGTTIQADFDNVRLTKVAAVAPTMGVAKVVGGNLILTGTNGTPGTRYTWLVTTNLALPLSRWPTNRTGTLDGNGGFSNAVPMVTSQLANFFRLRLP
ncbi:MAG: hypothetical protein JF609_03080, partial [Verrucomicrobia bacterium]|nr:hypothetical protein [Verrucomicrobiota bacterium]